MDIVPTCFGKTIQLSRDPAGFPRMKGKVIREIVFYKAANKNLQFLFMAAM
jgi:hypothetical protein